MASAAAFRRQVHAFVDRTLSPEAQSKRLAQIARRELDGLVSAGRASKSYRRFVDGREGAAEETVAPAPHGRIVYRFNHLGAVVTFALSFLKQRSPAPSGRAARPAQGKHGAYRDSFYVGVNGRFILAANFNPDAVSPGAEIVIGNLNAYSRKVDVQLVGLESLAFSVPAGLFDDAVTAIRARYGSLVTVKRVYTMSFPGQYLLKRAQRHRRRIGKPVESPALIITPRV